MAFDERWVEEARRIVGGEGVLVDREAMAA